MRHLRTAEQTVSTVSTGMGAMEHNAVMLIYDGDCGFCTKVAKWYEQQLTTPISVVPWQQISDLSELGLTIDDVTTAAYWVDAYGRTWRAHQAVGRALMRAKAPYAWLGPFFIVAPTSWVTAVLYRIVAKNRFRLPGATEACALPPHRATATATAGAKAPG